MAEENIAHQPERRKQVYATSIMPPLGCYGERASLDRAYSFAYGLGRGCERATSLAFHCASVWSGGYCSCLSRNLAMRRSTSIDSSSRPSARRALAFARKAS